jgi:type IV pilus assembly protein PilV
MQDPAPIHRHGNRPAARAGAPRRAGRGFSLLETLISIVIFAFGLLGLVGLQAKAAQYAVSAEDTNRAALLAGEIATQMWTRRSVQLPGEVVDAWAARVGDAAGVGLPNGQGEVQVDAGVATVTVSWRPPSRRADEPAHRYRTQVVVP